MGARSALPYDNPAAVDHPIFLQRQGFPPPSNHKRPAFRPLLKNSLADASSEFRIYTKTPGESIRRGIRIAPLCKETIV